MSANVLLTLLDMKAYRDRLVPAHRALAENGNVAPIRELLREAAPRTPDVESPFDLIDLNRNPEYVRKKTEAQQAQHRGDPGPMRELRELAAELTARRSGPRLLTRKDARAAMDLLGRKGVDAATREQFS